MDLSAADRAKIDGGARTVLSKGLYTQQELQRELTTLLARAVNARAAHGIGLKERSA